MVAGSSIIEDCDTNGERLFVAVDPLARYTVPKVANCRLGALLAPFQDEATAIAALADAAKKGGAG